MIGGEDARNKRFTKRYGEISREKKKHKQKTKVKTHSWDEKKLQNMVDDRRQHPSRPLSLIK